VRKSQRERNADETLVDQVLELDETCRKAKYEFDGLRKQKNDISKVVAQKKKDSKGQDKCEEEVALSKELDGKVKEQEIFMSEVIAKQDTLLKKIGNIVDPRACISNTEDDNVIMRTFGTPNKDIVADGSKLGSLHHHEVMQCLDMVEFERGQKVAGHRGYYLKGMGVMLNQALINYGLATLVKEEYTPI
jgi:seryl-tRNA synthetase